MLVTFSVDWTLVGCFFLARDLRGGGGFAGCCLPGLADSQHLSRMNPVWERNPLIFPITAASWRGRTPSSAKLREQRANGRRQTGSQSQSCDVAAESRACLRKPKTTVFSFESLQVLLRSLKQLRCAHDAGGAQRSTPHSWRQQSPDLDPGSVIGSGERGGLLADSVGKIASSRIILSLSTLPRSTLDPPRITDFGLRSVGFSMSPCVPCTEPGLW